MKTRLKTALDEKRDFEIEYLQLQKNYLKAKNAAKLGKDGELIQSQLNAAKSDVAAMQQKVDGPAIRDL